METGYAQVLLTGMGLTVGSRALSHYFYGMHRAMVVMVAALVGNVVNVVANAVLIYGQAGPPEGTPFAPLFGEIARALDVPTMQVSGAALGTVIGSGFELLIPLALFLGPRYNREFKTRAAWKPGKKIYLDILRIGWPAGAMFTNEMICWGYLMGVLLAAGGAAAGENPDLHNTAGWIALRYMHLSFMPAVGVSIAMTAMVGKAMGMGRPDLAASHTWLGVKVNLVYMGSMALAFVVLREPMIRIFADARETPPEMLENLVRVGSVVMIAAAVFQLFDAVAISISGALRGAGDTVWPGVVTIISSWICIVLGGHLMIELAPQLGSLGPWIGGAAYIISLGVLFLGRFMGGKWRSMSLVDTAHPGPRAATEPCDPGPSPEIVAQTGSPEAIAAELDGALLDGSGHEGEALGRGLSGSGAEKS